MHIYHVQTLMYNYVHDIVFLHVSQYLNKIIHSIIIFMYIATDNDTTSTHNYTSPDNAHCVVCVMIVCLHCLYCHVWSTEHTQQ